VKQYCAEAFSEERRSDAAYIILMIACKSIDSISEDAMKSLNLESFFSLIFQLLPSLDSFTVSMFFYRLGKVHYKMGNRDMGLLLAVMSRREPLQYFLEQVGSISWRIDPELNILVAISNILYEEDLEVM
jgi:hypothetical protein